MTDTRKDFDETWLLESPQGIPPGEYASAVESSIAEIVSFNKSIGNNVIDLPNGLKKMELSSVVYYWYEDEGKMTLGVELSKKPQGLVVNIIGKYNKGQPPYASELYNSILKDRKNSTTIDAIRIMSDKFLSEEGMKIWERLLDQGHMIMIYDSKNPGQTQKRISTVEELHSFFRMNDPSFKYYQYVISESTSFADIISTFNLRRIREIHNIL